MSDRRVRLYFVIRPNGLQVGYLVWYDEAGKRHISENFLSRGAVFKAINGFSVEQIPVEERMELCNEVQDSPLPWYGDQVRIPA